MSMKEPCPNKCKAGHIFTQGKWVRCECLKANLYKRELGVFATPDPKKDTPLLSYTEENLLIEGPMSQVRRHISGVILSLKSEGKTFTSMDSYRLVEIFVDQDQEFKSMNDMAEHDLFVMMLGFGEIKNQRLPDLILNVLMRRELKQKPTWVVMGMPIGQVPTRFNTEVFDTINQYKKVSAR